MPSGNRPKISEAHLRFLLISDRFLTFDRSEPLPPFDLARFLKNRTRFSSLATALRDLRTDPRLRPVFLLTSWKPPLRRRTTTAYSKVSSARISATLVTWVVCTAGIGEPPGWCVNTP